jgi:hypothetical protein
MVPAYILNEFVTSVFRISPLRSWASFKQSLTHGTEYTRKEGLTNSCMKINEGEKLEIL